MRILNNKKYQIMEYIGIKEEAEKIVIITVLGSKDDDVYSQRILHGIKLAKQYIEFFDSIHLIVKWYKNSKWSYETIKKLVNEINCEKIVLHKDKETLYYRCGKFSFDTIEEAAMIRISLEKLFKNRKVYLTIVTSKVHSKRSDFIFSSLFEDFQIKKNISSIVFPYNPSKDLLYINYSDNSFTEENEGREIKENKIFNKIVSEKKAFQDFLSYYENRIITFKGEIDLSGKKELLILSIF